MSRERAAARTDRPRNTTSAIALESARMVASGTPRYAGLMPATLAPGKAPDAPLRGELRYCLELARLLADRDFLRPPRGPLSSPALLVPGFMAGDQSLTMLAGWLRRRGARTAGAGIVLNTDCAERAVRGIEARL